MGQYTTKGLYNGYDKNHKERDKLDYYATPPKEVLNILKTYGEDFSHCIILEPCIGGGHMLEGINRYVVKNEQNDVNIIGTDIKERECVGSIINGYPNCNFSLQYGLDFMADDYPYNEADWVIMNPPYSLIEPFVIRSLEIAKKGVIMLARVQFLEGEKRFEHILKENPPTSAYIYVDRIACYKNGDFSTKHDSAQCYAWFVWDKREHKEDFIKTYNIRRADKKGEC